MNVAGVKQEVVVIEVGGGLTVTLPVERSAAAPWAGQ